MKKYWPLVLISTLTVLLIFGYVQKGKLNNLISDKMIQEAGASNINSAEEFIQNEYNYQLNKGEFEYTLLEFSSTGCTICEQMEPVLEEIKTSENFKVNVVFLHIMKPENLGLMKYYGISAVPMQILLDSAGKEFFRHYGFISAEELISKLQSN